jgi:hypothetical protein
MLPLLFPEVYDHLLCFVDVECECEVIFLTPNSEGPHLLPVGLLVVIGNHPGAALQNVQDPVAQGGVETQGLKLNDEFGGYYGIKC